MYHMLRRQRVVDRLALAAGGPGVEREHHVRGHSACASQLKRNPLSDSTTLITRGVTTMHAQLITYQLHDISQPDYLTKMVEPDAPILAKVTGLISKVWLADEDRNTFGGFYLWESKEAMVTFMHSDLVKAVVSRPFVKNVSSVDFTVNETASQITRGLK
jgi:hypothetical protein